MITQQTWGRRRPLPPVMSTPTPKTPIVGLTDIAVIIDRSGSMGSLTKATIDGFNGFVKEQQNVTEGKARLTLTLFDTRETGNVEVVYENLPIEHVAPLTNRTYEPYGSTPLYDAVGVTIERMARQKLGENVLVVLITDGYENASQRYTQQRVKALIEHYRAQGWQFIFLGANIEKEVAYQMGYDSGSTYAFTADSANMGNVMRGVSVGTTMARSGGQAILNESDYNV